MGGRNCAQVGLCSCERQEMGSGRPRGAGREGVQCRQERSPTGNQDGRKELVRRRGLPESDQGLTQLRARLCTALHGQQESSLLSSNTSLLKVSLDRALAQSPHTPSSIQSVPCSSSQCRATSTRLLCPTPPLLCTAWRLLHLTGALREIKSHVVGKGE